MLADGAALWIGRRCEIMSHNSLPYCCKCTKMFTGFALCLPATKFSRHIGVLIPSNLWAFLAFIGGRHRFGGWRLKYVWEFEWHCVSPNPLGLSSDSAALRFKTAAPHDSVDDRYTVLGIQKFRLICLTQYRNGTICFFNGTRRNSVA